MAFGAVILIAFLGTISSLSNWRTGPYWLIFLTAVQDPLRKMIPGAPSIVLLASAPIMLAMLVGLLGKRNWFGQIRSLYPIASNRLNLFLLACIPAAFISLTYSANSWLLTVFGIYAYGIFFISIAFGFHFARSPQDIRKLISFYCLISTIMLSGTFLEYFNLRPGWITLGTKAFEMNWIRYSGNYVVELVAGFYRSPDVMGWHAAATSMLSFFLATTSKPPRRFLWLIICSIAIVALFFCGRRKMFYMLPVAAIILFLIYLRARNTSQLFNLVPIVVIPALIMLYTSNILGDDSTYVSYYRDNLTDTTDQLQKHGFQSLIATVQQSGFFGSGLGSASPGTHNLNVVRPRTWQESGPSRIMVELGVPGFFALMFFMVALLRSAWSEVQTLLSLRSYLAMYGAGLLAFLLANIGGLIVSGQILADAFITFFLGFSLGLILSFAKDRQALLYRPPYPWPPLQPANTSPAER
ncbi:MULTISPECIES: hypothetical protein [unclassified Synechocystis]|uniref:hypothetical protein n=1 Tax=unclassified Synechocystis TaxID=2640012 RepID=UPI00048F96C1|nr:MULTISPECIES: hypothetical protein [unclassified Synechocystis]AIE74696.1 hypothetical protein D082_21680 [Synechocystis sp. PCC 6714]MCT0253949.1 hypothetical protein [Synechocystis sp. CS-94]